MIARKQVSNGASDLFLNGEDILQLAAKRLGPKVMTAGGLNRLRSDPQLLAGLSDAAFNDEIRPEPLPYITDIDSDPFESAFQERERLVAGSSQRLRPFAVRPSGHPDGPPSSCRRCPGSGCGIGGIMPEGGKPPGPRIVPVQSAIRAEPHVT